MNAEEAQAEIARLRAALAEAQGRLAVMRNVESQLRQRLWALVETACPKCRKDEERAIRRIW